MGASINLISRERKTGEACQEGSAGVLPVHLSLDHRFPGFSSLSLNQLALLFFYPLYHRDDPGMDRVGKLHFCFQEPALLQFPVGDDPVCFDQHPSDDDGSAWAGFAAFPEAERH